MLKTEKSETDPVWAEAVKAKDEAVKARERATRAAAVVLVCHETLSAAQAKAADTIVAATEAEKRALEEANQARLALEKELGLPSQDVSEPAAEKKAKKS